VECPVEIREKVVFYAQEYAKRDTYFEWGGRDLLEKEGILEVDCSGIIVRAYQYAVKDTKYSLLFNDTNVSSFYEYFTIPVDIPMSGDIIFMGTNTIYPTHMSIFIGMDNENIYFIDSTYKEDEGIDGVSLRFYEKDDSRFLQFARLLVRL
jgi:cell wall-associated NlpC family hydrolase